jgi:hydroxymethylbilane synthase
VTGTAIRIGTRGSALALAQAELVRSAFATSARTAQLVIIETAGDRRAPDTAWGEGAFVAAIEGALLDGRVDVAVHSAKDIPTDVDHRLTIAAYLPRADPRDALVVRAGARDRRLAELPPGTRIGTDSPRRTAFVLAARSDLVVHPLHGNVDTRLRRLDAGETDALVLACAGLDRLGLERRIDERLDPAVIVPAPGQGAIAVQARAGDTRMLALGAAVDDTPTRLAVEAERMLLVECGGGCRSPIGALATITGDQLALVGAIGSIAGVVGDGMTIARGRRHGDATDGPALARALAGELMRDVRADAASAAAREQPVGIRPGRPRVLVTRAANQADKLLEALRVVGVDPIAVPTIAVEDSPAGGALDDAARRIDDYEWVVVTSANGARAILAAAERVRTEPGRPSWAAVGRATAATLEDAGLVVRFQPSDATASALAAELPIRDDDRVLVVRGDLAEPAAVDELRRRGATVDEVVGYRTREAPAVAGPALRAALAAGPIDAIVFTSGSTARGLRSLADREAIDVTSIPAVCIGAATAREAARAGFRVVAVSGAPDAATLADTVADALAPEPMEVS